MKNAIVTTIYAPSRAIFRLAEHFPCQVLVVGDRKTPQDWRCDGVDFWSFEQQCESGFALRKHVRPDHYARKNLGYLLAMRNQSSVIYDTDDDNVPNVSWKMREVDCDADLAVKAGWFNVYRLFLCTDIWPRGFALTSVLEPPPSIAGSAFVHCPIQQGLANGAPDVDAVCRMTNTLADGVHFDVQGSVALSRGVWCPFNSQSTWWFPEAFPLMYLPIHAPFRMTDIWRSFVAQRCLWEIGGHVAFHSPGEVMQERNPHNLLHDFEDEISGYLHNGEIVKALERLPLSSGRENVKSNLLSCYEALIRIGVLPLPEMSAVEAWVSDVDCIGGFGDR